MDKRIELQPPVNVFQSKEDFKRYWKSFGERVSLSLSGINNGHCIAATSSEYVWETTALMSGLPWVLGITLDCWLQSLNVELEKKAGLRLVSKLRAIHLLKADFNMQTKSILGQRMINHAIKHNQVPPSQYATKNAKVLTQC